VNAAASEVGYQANDLARGMKSGYTHTIGVIVTDIDNPFFAQAVKGIIAAADVSGYQLLISTSEAQIAREKTALRNLVSKQVDGVIVVPASTTDGAHLAKVQRDGIPVVLVDREIEGLSDVDSVVIDNVRGARRAVERLVSLGHRRIGIVTEAAREVFEDGGQRRSYSGLPSYERSRGYLRALREHDIAVDLEIIASANDRTQASAYAATQDLLRRRPDVTALFCTDNAMTSGAYRAVQDTGIECADRLSILGFDDHEWSTMVRPTLAVVAQPAFEVGQRAFSIVLSRVRGDPPAGHRRERLPSHLIERDSIRPV
jgi:LacI family transcriptional regulator